MDRLDPVEALGVEERQRAIVSVLLGAYGHECRGIQPEDPRDLGGGTRCVVREMRGLVKVAHQPDRRPVLRRRDDHRQAGDAQEL